MKKKSTSIFMGEAVATPQGAYLEEDTQTNAGSPRLSTLRMLRQFARAYHYDSRSAVPSGLILN